MARTDLDSIPATHARLIPVSGNSKTGPIPVSYSAAQTCPDACPLKDGNGCYAEGGNVRFHWRAAKHFGPWQAFLAAVRKMPRGQVWRHHAAGDLPGVGDALDTKALAQLVEAQSGRRGWTYTHKPMTRKASRDAVKAANATGFTVNLSADSLAEADQLASLEVGPVVVTLPADAPRVSKTPEGRTVIVCPAQYRDELTCARCQLCTKADRKAIVGFWAHGASAKTLNARLRVIQ